ncbi:MAG: UbiX family flavin prenyltransferase [Promethearchaeati archaeon SRVP18_Atabeyarchaeia-1]
MVVKRLIIAITGTSGVIYGVKMVEYLHQYQEDIETYLVISDAAKKILALETSTTPEALSKKVARYFEPEDIAAPIASGSFLTDGMVIVPCSMKTLASIASGYSDNLIARAADVALKERRRLIVVPRETPLSNIHLRNMLTLSEAGAVVLPPVPAFYHRPRTLDDIINYTIGKILDALGIEHKLFERWK